VNYHETRGSNRLENMCEPRSESNAILTVILSRFSETKALERYIAGCRYLRGDTLCTSGLLPGHNIARSFTTQMG